MAGTIAEARTPTQDVATPTAQTTRPVVTVRAADEAALADYEALCRNGVHAPPQHPLWIRSWIAATGSDVIIVTVERSGAPACTLALDVDQEGPFRIARYAGGVHANGNFAAVANRSTNPLSREEWSTLMASIKSARPDIDLMHLARQRPSFLGIENPLTGLAAVGSPDISLAIDLSQGFEALLSGPEAARKRRKHRQQIKKYNEAGGYREFIAQTPEDAERILSAFFAMKGARLEKLGIDNTFGTDEVQNFFRLLFVRSLEQAEPPFFLRGLEVGGEFAAVKGLSRTDDSIACDFSAFNEDVPVSPGEFLDYHCIEHTSTLGKQVFDFGVGDEPYKRRWCDIETWQFDTLQPLTAKGHVARLLKLSRGRAVRFIKSNNALWSMVKQLRAKVAGSSKITTSED